MVSRRLAVAYGHKTKEVLRRINRLLSFDTTRVALTTKTIKDEETHRQQDNLISLKNMGRNIRSDRQRSDLIYLKKN
jgi:hypothetical protein